MSEILQKKIKDRKKDLLELAKQYLKNESMKYDSI